MFSWIVDQIPWWVYVIGGLVITGGLFAFFGPIITPILAITPRWVKVGAGAVGAVFIAWIAGRNRGARDAKELQRRNDAQAVEHRNEVDQDVQNATPADVDKRLDRWMRPD